MAVIVKTHKLSDLDQEKRVVAQAQKLEGWDQGVGKVVLHLKTPGKRALQACLDSSRLVEGSVCGILPVRAYICVHISPLYKDTSPVGLGVHLTPVSTLINSPCINPISKQGYILRYRGLGFQCESLEGVSVHTLTYNTFSSQHPIFSCLIALAWPLI